FLFLVVAAVVGIFMYVMTLQKTAIFGVMKAQGIKNFFIAKSLVAQSFIVGVVGVLLALLFAYLTSLILPSAMPFAVFWSQWLLYSGILIIVAMLGGLFSIRSITKVDPITAIGGS
ncbi:ABC transporter permease, partial [Klebsiella pneumoniae]